MVDHEYQNWYHCQQQCCLVSRNRSNEINVVCTGMTLCEHEILVWVVLYGNNAIRYAW